jgi:predicted regulator of Ras-like GTPase activity (Roadblock/LC7/MglB family)
LEGQLEKGRSKASSMSKLSIPALVLLGGATFVGLSFLLSRTFPALPPDSGSAVAPVLVVAVAAALFVFGVFLGYLYSESAQGYRIKKDTLERFREALMFERQERLRLERELLEAKKMIVNLKDRYVRRSKPPAAGAKDPKNDQAAEAELKAKLQDLLQTREKLESDLQKRKERIADLLAELSVAQAETEQLKASSPATTASTLLGGSSLKDVLDELVELEGIQLALVADDYGLVVDSSGDGLPSEQVAAISTLVANVGPRVSEILPMGEVATISLGDDKGLVLDTRYFDLFGARCALAIARDEAHPYPGLAEQAAKAIVARFSE